MSRWFDWAKALTLMSPFVPVFAAFIGLFRKGEPSLTKVKGEARLWSWSISFDYHHDSRSK